MQDALIKIQAVDSQNELVEKTSQMVNEKQGKKGSRNKDPYFIVLAKAQKIFNEQIDTTRCGLYGDCVRMAVNYYNILTKVKEKPKGEGFSERQFKARFTEYVVDILDRKSFERQCNMHQVDPYVVATYVATMPAAKRQEVLRGSWGEIPQKFLDCGVPVFEVSELEEFDTDRNLLACFATHIIPQANG